MSKYLTPEDWADKDELTDRDVDIPLHGHMGVTDDDDEPLIYFWGLKPNELAWAERGVADCAAGDWDVVYDLLPLYYTYGKESFRDICEDEYMYVLGFETEYDRINFIPLYHIEKERSRDVPPSVYHSFD